MLSALTKQSVANTWHCCSTWHNGDKQMSKILEEYAAKRYAEGVRFGEQIYEQIGKHKTMLKCIKNLMQSKQLSVVEAMDALCIDENDRAYYLKHLQVADEPASK